MRKPTIQLLPRHASWVGKLKHYPKPENFVFQLAKLVETLEKQLTSKGSEINAFAEKHNIQVRGGGSAANAGNVAAQGKEEAENKKNAAGGSSGGILVQDGEKSW